MKQKQLYNRQGEPVTPITHMSSVTNEKGESLEAVLEKHEQAVQQNIDNAVKTKEDKTETIAHLTQRFDRLEEVTEPIVEQSYEGQPDAIIYDTKSKRFVYQFGDRYVNNFTNGDYYNETVNGPVRKDKVFLLGRDLYVYDDLEGLKKSLEITQELGERTDATISQKVISKEIYDTNEKLSPFSREGANEENRPFWEGFVRAIEIPFDSIPPSLNGNPYPEGTTGWSIAQAKITEDRCSLNIYRSGEAWKQWRESVSVEFKKPKDAKGIHTFIDESWRETGVFVTVDLDKWEILNKDSMALETALNKNVFIENTFAPIKDYKSEQESKKHEKGIEISIYGKNIPCEFNDSGQEHNILIESKSGDLIKLTNQENVRDSEMYFIRDDGSFKGVDIPKIKGRGVLTDEPYKYLRYFTIVSAPPKVNKFVVNITNDKTVVTKFENGIYELDNSINGLQYMVSTNKGNAYIDTNINAKKGQIIVLTNQKKVGSEFYLFRENGTYVSGIASELKTNGYELQEDFVKLRYISPEEYEGIEQGFTINIFDKDSLRLATDKINRSINYKPFNILILGDSYSENGGAWVRPMMSYLPGGSEWKCLAVSSATIKDSSNDRVTYPYTDRPVSSDNKKNHNTLACQIQKLKRLMAGTDLDSGETQWYKTPNEYPNIIIIEGGMNDVPDSDSVEATYFNQLAKKVDNVYIASKVGGAVTQDSCVIRTPIEDVDRTCFAGAYRYISEELLSLFPNAQIFVTTCSTLGYPKSDIGISRMKKAEQQRYCADMYSFNLIDWHRNGQINTIVNHITGSGTQDDPYIWQQQVRENADSGDYLHPNGRGGLKYGRLASIEIMKYYLNIDR